MGNITIELFKDKAPISVRNFLGYVADGFYDGLIFHRVINGFMVQGGGMDENMQPKKTKFAIKKVISSLPGWTQAVKLDGLLALRIVNPYSLILVTVIVLRWFTILA